MLQNLLPGLRELRAPLSAGYVWLLGLWILLGPIFTDRDLTGTLYARLIDLSTWAGRPATLLALSFVAYLLGVLSGSLTTLINTNSYRLLGNHKFLRRLIPHHRNEETALTIIGYAVESRLVRRYEADSGFKARVLGHWRRAVYMSQKYGHTLRPTRFAGLSDDDVERRADEDSTFRQDLVLHVVDVENHIPHSKVDADFIRYRLTGREDQIHNEFDRTWSEGEFRLGLAIPSMFLWIALAIADSPWWLAGITFSVTIAYVGAKSFSEADMFLYSVMASGRIPLESIDQLRPDQIRMVPYVLLVAIDSPRGTRDAVTISLSENEFRKEMYDDEQGSPDA